MQTVPPYGFGTRKHAISGRSKSFLSFHHLAQRSRTVVSRLAPEPLVEGAACRPLEVLRCPKTNRIPLEQVYWIWIGRDDLPCGVIASRSRVGESRRAPAGTGRADIG